MAWTIWIKPNRRWKQGGWQGVYRDADGKQRSAGIYASKRRAEQEAQAKEVDVRRGDWIDPDGPRTLFRDWVKTWRTHHRRTVRDSTDYNTTVRLNVRLLPTFGDLQLGGPGPRKITRSRIQRWVDDMADRGIPDGSIRAYLSLLATILNAAVDEALIARSPCRGIVIPETVRRSREGVALAPAQAGSIIAGIPSWWRTLGLLPLGTALRWGEAVGLRDVGLDGGWITVDGALKETGGRKTRGATKTRAGRRVVPIPETLLDPLKTLVENVTHPEGYLFVGPMGALADRNWAISVWAPAVWDSGLYPDPADWTTADPAVNAEPDTDAGGDTGGVRYTCPVRYHDARRTAASWWEAGGLSRVAVEQLLGHKGGSTIIDRYVRPLPEHAELARAEREAWRRQQRKNGVPVRRGLLEYLPLDVRAAQ